MCPSSLGYDGVLEHLWSRTAPTGAPRGLLLLTQAQLLQLLRKTTGHILSVCRRRGPTTGQFPSAVYVLETPGHGYLGTHGRGRGALVSNSKTRKTTPKYTPERTGTSTTPTRWKSRRPRASETHSHARRLKTRHSMAGPASSV